MTIILISFFSGILTVLAPCVLPLLPVILSGGLAAKSKKRPLIIIASLIASLLIFTVILKVSTVFIGINPLVWNFIAGGLLVLFSLTLIFPLLWVWVMNVTGIERMTQDSLRSAGQKEGVWGPILLGAALGPVFSSCNPTYTVLLATILPTSLTMGLLGLSAYFVGLGAVLLAIVYFGRSIIGRFGFFVNPYGIFRKILGGIILLVGLGIVTGYGKQVETYFIDKNIFFNTISIDNALNDVIIKNHNNQGGMCANGKCGDQKESALLVDLSIAPELKNIETWINSDSLTLSSLRGKVVLIDFWTYSCINCQRTQPYLNTWYDRYEKDGLVIIGVHAPEFAFEKLERNVREASKKAGIKYPVALDNDFSTWNAYGNRYWPAKYLIDQTGKIVYKHFGEGKYDETESKIREVLGLDNDQGIMNNDQWQDVGEVSATEKITPEIYLGSARGAPLGDKDVLSMNEWQTFGDWKQESEYLELVGNDGFVKLNFRAKKSYLVVSGKTPGILQVSAYRYYSDGRMVKQGPIQEKTLTILQDDLYTVFDGDEIGDYTLQIIASPGIRFHAFTFGK